MLLVQNPKSNKTSIIFKQYFNIYSYDCISKSRSTIGRNTLLKFKEDLLINTLINDFSSNLFILKNELEIKYRIEKQLINLKNLLDFEYTDYFIIL